MFSNFVGWLLILLVAATSWQNHVSTVSFHVANFHTSMFLQLFSKPIKTLLSKIYLINLLEIYLEHRFEFAHRSYGSVPAIKLHNQPRRLRFMLNNWVYSVYSHLLTRPISPSFEFRINFAPLLLSPTRTLGVVSSPQLRFFIEIELLECNLCITYTALTCTCIQFYLSRSLVVVRQGVQSYIASVSLRWRRNGSRTLYTMLSLSIADVSNLLRQILRF